MTHVWMTFTSSPSLLSLSFLPLFLSFCPLPPFPLPPLPLPLPLPPLPLLPISQGSTWSLFLLIYVVPILQTERVSTSGDAEDSTRRARPSNKDPSSRNGRAFPFQSPRSTQEEIGPRRRAAPQEPCETTPT